MQSQVNQVEPKPRLADQVGTVSDIDRRFRIDDGLWFLRPEFGLGQTSLQLSDAGEILRQLLSIAGPEPLLQLFGLAADGVKNALSIGQAAGLRGNFVGGRNEKDLSNNFQNKSEG